MLLKSPGALVGTDTPESVLEVLRSSKIRHVEAVGRRGPGQVSFTTKEFREMLNLQGVEYKAIDSELMIQAKEMVEREGDRARKRLLGLMEKGVNGDKISPESRVFELGFLKSPIAFNPDPVTGDVRSVRWSINSLLVPPTPPASPVPPPPIAPSISSNDTPSAAVVARPTGKEVESDTGLVIESVGYKSESISDDDGWRLPFDERRGRILNDGGRILDESGVMVSLQSPLSLHVCRCSDPSPFSDTRLVHGRMGSSWSNRRHRINHAKRLLSSVSHPLGSRFVVLLDSHPQCRPAHRSRAWDPTGG